MSFSGYLVSLIERDLGYEPPQERFEKRGDATLPASEEVERIHSGRLKANVKNVKK